MKYVTAWDLAESIMDDVPKINYLAAIGAAAIADAIKQLPPALSKFIEADPHGVRFLARKAISLGRLTFSIPNVDYEMPISTRERLDAIADLHFDQLHRRGYLHARLISLVTSPEDVPELAKYMEGARVLPTGERAMALPFGFRVQTINALRLAGWHE